MLSAAYFGGEPPYVRLYRLLIDDPDPTVRAACVHALGLHGTAEDAGTMIALMDDENAFVRWEAAKALQKIHSQDAVGPLIKSVLGDEDEDVRMAAAHALGQYAQPRVFQALVGALDDTSYGVVRAAHASLTTLTGEDLGPDGRRWLGWLRQDPSSVFVGQRAYVWHPYRGPRSWWNKIQFWKSSPGEGPQTPVGLSNQFDPPEPS